MALLGEGRDNISKYFSLGGHPLAPPPCPFMPIFIPKIFFALTNDDYIYMTSGFLKVFFSIIAFSGYSKICIYKVILT